MNNKLPKFLLAFDRNYQKKYIVHTQFPKIIVETDGNELLTEEILKDHADSKITGLIMRMKDWLKSVNIKQFAPDIKKNKFLFSVDPINKELYILHREFPACLIWVKQEIPVKFVIQDLYDDVKNVNEIVNMPFVQEAKDYYKKYGESVMGGN